VDLQDVQGTLRLRLLVNLLLLLGSVSLLFGMAHVASGTAVHLGVILLIAAMSSPAVLLQLRLGVPRGACVLQFMAAITACIAAAGFYTSGVLSPIMAWLTIVPVFGLALHNRRSALIGGVLMGIAMVVLGVLTVTGQVHPLAMPSPIKEIVSGLGLMALMASLVVVGILSENTRTAVLDDLAKTNQTLREEVTNHTDTRLRLQKTHRQLVDAARVAGAAEVATGVLHNLGNALNAVNVSASLMDSKVAGMRLDRVERLNEVLTDERAKKYVSVVFDDLSRARSELRSELEAIRRGVNHATATVSAQQRHAGQHGIMERIELQELLDDALLLTTHRHDAVTEVRIHCKHVPRLMLDRHRLVQIVTNLVGNAHDALREVDHPGRIDVHGAVEDDNLVLSVSDNGVGITDDDMDRVFAHGFTTKADGHGFGLHACALSAQEVGGSLTVHSEVPGKGATFTLRLPVEIAQSTRVAL